MTKQPLKSSGIYFEDENFPNLNVFLKKNKFSSIIVLADSHTLKHCYPILFNACEALQKAELIEIEPGEENKTINTCISVWNTLTELNTDKKTLLINVGGGVICDLGGFIASTFKRGIKFIHIPTSLMAMADASVGGKCGIDFGGIKNHIGTITQPNGVFIHSSFLNTLPNQHLKNGMAEIIKIAFIADESLQKQLALKTTMLHDLIKKSVQLKYQIVKKDQFDQGIRQSLNFGHTAGHAIESVLLGTKKELLHGEAVAIGMIIESFLAQQMKLITAKHFKTISGMILPNYPLPALTKKDINAIIQFMGHDKKNESALILMSLPQGKASCRIKTPVNTEDIRKAFDYYNTLRK